MKKLSIPTLHEAEIATLKAQHQAEIQHLKDSWITAQKVQTAVAGNHYGTIWELEHRGIITTSVDPDGWVIWQLVEIEKEEETL